MPALIALAAIVAAPGYGVPDARDLVAAASDLRADPPRAAEALDDFARRFDPATGSYYDPDDPDTEHVTREGVGAVDEAADVLRATAPLPPLAWSDTLARAATMLAKEQARTSGIGHVGRDGSTPGLRARRAGGDIYVAEVIAYGASDAADALRQLIVDDGVRGRGHRALLLMGHYRYAGAACAPHPTYRTVCVMDLAATPTGAPVVPGAGQ